MSDLLFATPWWLVGSLIIVGGVVFWSGNNRQQKGPQKVGVALIALAIVLKTLSFFIETDKEKVTRHTNELVAAVQNRDWSKFSSLLDDDVSLDTVDGTVCPNRELLVATARADAEGDNLTNVSAHITGVEQDATGITVDLDVSGQVTDSLGYPVPTSWKLNWDRAGTDWHLHEITCLKIGNEKADQFARWIKK